MSEFNVAALDETHVASRRSWVTSANEHSEFPIQNLPLGIFSRDGSGKKLGIAIGDDIFDVSAASRAGLLGDAGVRAVDASHDGSVNRLFALGLAPLRALRRSVFALLDADGAGRARAERLADTLLHPITSCTLDLPTTVPNYTDFYAGIYHARAARALMKPEDPSLPPNYAWIPIAYHGRASSVVAGGAAIRRPCGQRPPGRDGRPSFGPTGQLDIELEMGFYIGRGNALGQAIPMPEAAEHIAGYCLLNDWSARDIQGWEMAPLGPFLGKSFSTSVSPWVVTADALLPFRIPPLTRPQGEPAPLPYLQDAADRAFGGLEVALTVLYSTARMRAAGDARVPIIRSSSRYLYWTPAQMVAHHSSGGCNLTPGDLIGTGTISGPSPAQSGSLLELTAAGRQPIELPNGERRGFLADGDEVTLTARCSREGFATIGFGECAGRIES